MNDETIKQKGLFGKLRTSLGRTRARLFGEEEQQDLPADDLFWSSLEDHFLAADMGQETASYLYAELKKRVLTDDLRTQRKVKRALAEVLTRLLLPLEKPLALPASRPWVIMMTGVNGSGKTTTIGKLVYYFSQQNQKLLLGACDTFRAAAVEQLQAWGKAADIPVIAQAGGDPAAVAFDSAEAAKARHTDGLIVDTAGRLPTQEHLMRELQKIKRTLGKSIPDAPHEVILVLDGSTGQNAFMQIDAFDKAVTLTGLIVTKVDGSAKAGFLAALAKKRPLPVYFLGTGEKIDDLLPFQAHAFAAALVE